MNTHWVVLSCSRMSTGMGPHVDRWVTRGSSSFPYFVLSPLFVKEAYHLKVESE